MKYYSSENRHRYTAFRHVKLIFFYFLSMFLVYTLIASAFLIPLSISYDSDYIFPSLFIHFMVLFLSMPILLKDVDIYSIRLLYVDEIVPKLCQRVGGSVTASQALGYRNKHALDFRLMRKYYYASRLSGLLFEKKTHHYSISEERLMRIGASKADRGGWAYFYKAGVRNFRLDIAFSEGLTANNFVLSKNKRDIAQAKDWLDEHRSELSDQTFKGKIKGFDVVGCGPEADTVYRILNPHVMNAIKALQKNLSGCHVRLTCCQNGVGPKAPQIVSLIIRSHKTLGAPHFLMVKSRDRAVSDGVEQVRLVEAFIQGLEAQKSLKSYYKNCDYDLGHDRIVHR